MPSKSSKSKAAGLDRITARLLRECPDRIADSLCLIFNHSINSGVFPDEWKRSKVIPLFKQGERHDPNNYRPISIIPVVAKVFERIIYDQVKAFIDENKLFFRSQSGFRSLHSTVTKTNLHQICLVQICCNMKFAKLCNQRKGGNGRICTN